MNPTGQPFPPQLGGTPPGPGAGAAKDAVNVPSLLLLIFGAIGILWGLVSMLGAGANLEQLESAMGDPNFPEGAKAALRFVAGPGAKLINLFAIAVLGVMTFGAWQMRNLKSYGLSMTPACSACSPARGAAASRSPSASGR